MIAITPLNQAVIRNECFELLKMDNIKFIRGTTIQTSIGRKIVAIVHDKDESGKDVYVVVLKEGIAKMQYIGYSHYQYDADKVFFNLIKK